MMWDHFQSATVSAQTSSPWKCRISSFSLGGLFLSYLHNFYVVASCLLGICFEFCAFAQIWENWVQWSPTCCQYTSPWCSKKAECRAEWWGNIQCWLSQEALLVHILKVFGSFSSPSSTLFSPLLSLPWLAVVLAFFSFSSYLPTTASSYLFSWRVDIDLLFGF